MSKLKVLAAFVTGLGIGGAVAYSYTKKKIEERTDAEISAVKEMYKNKAEKAVEETTTEEPAEEVIEEPVNEVTEEAKEEKASKETQREYHTYVKNLGYTHDDDTITQDTPDDEEDDNDRPYVISPDEFGEYDHYDTMFYTYYSDDVVCDDNGHIVQHPEEVLGDDFRNKFHHDLVFVRDDRIEADYEVEYVTDPYSAMC